MANTRFKTENGLLVTGGNAHFQNEVNMYANLVVDADLVLVRGDLLVEGAQVFTGGQIYSSDIVAELDGLNLGNTTNQFNAFLGTVRVFDGLFPSGNTLPLGNSTNRWVITANTLNLSGNAAITGAVTLSNTLSATGAVTFSNTLSVTGAVTFANTLSVTGVVSTSANANFNSGVLFVDAVNDRVGINNTAPGVALRVTGAADISSTANIQGNANVGGTLGVAGLLTATGGLTAGAVNTSFDTSVLFVDALNNRVGINNTAPGVDLRVTGAVDISGTANIQNNANVSGTLGVSGITTLGGNVVISGTSHTVAGNTNFATSTLMVDSALTRVGIGTSTPDAKLQVVGTANIGGNMRLASDLNVVGSATVGGTFRVTGAANAMGTFGITGAANAMGTLGITGAANAMGTLGVGGLLTAAAGLTVTGITNTSTAFNVSGGVATTNGASINTTSIAVGNTTSYTNIQPIKITTFIPAVSQEAQIAYANSTGSLWFYQAYAHRATDSWSLNRADGTSYLSTMMAAFRSNNSLLFNANAHVFVGNANFAAINATSVNATSINAVSVNAASHTVGSALIANSTGVYHTGVINATSVNAASYTIGSIFIANTAGITHSGYANIAGTLEADGRVVFANTNNRAVVIGAETFGSGVSGNNLISAGRTYTGAESSHVMYKSISIANAALTSGSVSHLGDRVFIENKSLTRTDAGATTSSALYGYYADVINGTGNSSINTLYGSAAILQNQANGTFANSVTTAMSGYFLYRSSGSGTTGTAYGVQGRIDAANNAVTGNITTAISVVSTIESNTAMTIGTGILYYGAHAGSKTTDKYGLYILNESNNYVSGDFYVGGNSLKIPTGTQSDRPTAAAGLIRLNTTSASFEGHNGSTWIPLGSGAVNLGGGSISGLSSTSIAVPSTIRVIHLSGYLYNVTGSVQALIPRSWIRLATSSTILTSGYVNSRDNGNIYNTQNVYFPISEFNDNNYSRPLFFNSILTYDAQGYWHISTHATTFEWQPVPPINNYDEVFVDYHNHGIIACNPLATIYIYRNTGTWTSGSWVRAYGLTST